MKDKNKITVFVSVIVLLLIGMFLFARPGKNKNIVSNSTGIPVGAEELENSHTVGSSGALTAEEIFYDFGTISMKNGLTSKIFKVSNSSSGDINLEKLTTSCMCTTAYILKEDGRKSRPFGMPGHGGGVPKANELIKAGESRDIEVVYDPNAHGPAGVGMVDRFVYLEDSNGTVLQLEIKANVTP